ncbi:MAG: hypothetical protein GY870_01185, partial [archaeon]|nr:hypothetical protein [archaeon]
MENKSAHEVLKESILSKPRMMGTPGEKETTEFLTDYLEKNNIKSHTEQMDWSNASVIGRKILFIFAIVAVLFL